jgi:hypothetical protein
MTRKLPEFFIRGERWWFRCNCGEKKLVGYDGHVQCCDVIHRLPEINDKEK